MFRSEWMARMLKAQTATFNVLRRIESEAGYQYKELTAVDVADYKECPTWFDGRIEIGYNNDPESISHEIAHGLHEKIRETGKQNVLGEEFSNAIRYYVEKEVCPSSEWLKGFATAQNPFIHKYDTSEKFIAALKSGKIFTDVHWK